MAHEIIGLEAARIRQGDYIVRGTAADGQIRAFAITARQTVQTAHESLHTSPLVTAALGRLMMAGQMMGAMSKNDDELLTLIIRGDGPVGGLTVTANNKGQVKGYANHPNVWIDLNQRGKLDVGGGIGAGTLTVIHDIPGFDPYSSEAELVSGEIGDDLTNFFVMSDQVPTSVGVGVLVDTDTSVRQAGGFIVQLMPGYDPAVVDQLEHNLQGLDSVTNLLERGMTPTDILAYVLRDLDYQELETLPAEFHCGCNDERASRAVLALGASELTDMIEKDEPAETYCTFCGKHYHFAPSELQEMLTKAQA